PSRLPATIRSRCQRLEMRLPPRDEALAWLHAQGHDVDTAQAALDAPRGPPGLADAWLRDGGLARREDVAADLARVARGACAASPVRSRPRSAGPRTRTRRCGCTTPPTSPWPKLQA